MVFDPNSLVLPGTKSAGDPGHADDHNLITTAISDMATDISTDLSGKVADTGDTITGPLVVTASEAGTLVRITQTGAGDALVVEDSSNPDSTPFKIDANGQVTTGLGSATDPAIAYAGDTNTGIFSPGADTLAVSTGGTERLRVGSTGNVGIGTNIPSSVLHIASNSQANPTIDTSASSAAASNIYFRKSRGTLASPAAVQDGDSLASIFAQGHDGTAYISGARILAQVDGTPGTNDMPGRLAFYTTADGTASLSERMRIDNAGLITGTGTSLGAWTAYTPTLGGTGWAIGDGTLSFYYAQIGKIVHVRGFLQWGSTSTYGSGSLTLTTQVASSSTGTHRPVVSTLFYDTSAGKYFAGYGSLSGSTVTFYGSDSGANMQLDGLISTRPFTWASGDQIRCSFTYEAA